MPDQGVFDFYRDWPARPQRPERLFFAVLPDHKTAGHVAQFRERFVDQYHLKGSQIRPERMHVSVRGLGDHKRLRSSLLYAAVQAGSAVSKSPFEVTFRFIRSFEPMRRNNGRPRWPLVLLGESDGLFGLHHNLETAISKSGLRPAELVQPHLTLLYGLKPIALQAIEPIRLVVNEFVLIHSELWLTRYNMIHRWSLKD